MDNRTVVYPEKVCVLGTRSVVDFLGNKVDCLKSCFPFGSRKDKQHGFVPLVSAAKSLYTQSKPTLKQAVREPEIFSFV